MAGTGRGSSRDARLRDTRKRLRRRVVMVGIVFVALAGVLGWRLVSLQILEPDRYLAHGAAQRIRIEVLPAGRGAIVDRNGVDLALSVPRRSVVADPRLIEDPSSAAWAMAAVLDTDVSVLERRLASDRSFVYLDRQVADDVADSALALDLAGVYTIKELARLRPGDDSALALLGRTDIDNNGVSGLELVYDGMLSGVPGESIIEVGVRGSTIPGGEYRVVPADEGLSIVLTIDRALQFEAERLLADTLTRDSRFELFYLVDSRGVQISENVFAADVAHGEDASCRGRDWSQRPWFRAVAERMESHITQVYRSSATDDFCFTVSVPIVDERGQLLRVLGADVRLSALV